MPMFIAGLSLFLPTRFCAECGDSFDPLHQEEWCCSTECETEHAELDDV